MVRKNIPPSRCRPLETCDPNVSKNCLPMGGRKNKRKRRNRNEVCARSLSNLFAWLRPSPSCTPFEVIPRPQPTAVGVTADGEAFWSCSELKIFPSISCTPPARSHPFPYPALSKVSTPMAASRASSVIVIVDTGMRNDFMGHVIVLSVTKKILHGWARRLQLAHTSSEKV